MLLIYRLSALLHHWGIPLLPRCLYFLNRCIFSVVLPPSVKIGRNVTFAYQGLATVVHARAIIGSNCYIGPNVIIGGRSSQHAVPEIADDVFIGAAARILGPVKIGRGATIGAAALVLEDVAAGSTVVGSPARPIANARKEAPNVVAH